VRYRVNSVWLIVVVTVPAIVYLWSSGASSTAAVLAYTVALVLAGMADTGLKPLMLGRGVEAPIPVMLLGALGGMAAAGLLGMFVGATLLTLGYQIFLGWVAANPPTGPAQAASDAQAAGGRAGRRCGAP
jgi:predicted PurR-regulated permease PerM